MALGCKKIALGWNVFNYSVKCLTHGLRGFNGAVQRRLATLTVTMLISSCWQLLSEIELRHIFDVCKQSEPTRIRMNLYRKILFDTWGHTGDSITAHVRMQCANRRFWPLVSKYTIMIFTFSSHTKYVKRESIVFVNKHSFVFQLTVLNFSPIWRGRFTTNSSILIWLDLLKRA